MTFKDMNPNYLKKFYPGLASYFYLNKKKRVQYFSELNNDYVNTMHVEGAGEGDGDGEREKEKGNVPMASRLKYNDDSNILQNFFKEESTQNVKFVQHNNNVPG